MRQRAAAGVLVSLVLLLGPSPVAAQVYVRGGGSIPSDLGVRYQRPAGPRYYVSAAGADSNDGRSASSPWLTLAKVNSSTFAPGDRVLLRTGDTWRETLTPPSSGSAGLPITFGAYGSGALPVISGSDLLTAWTLEAQAPGEDFTDGTGAKPISWWGFAETVGSRADSNLTNNETLAVSSGTLTRVAGPNARVPYAVQFVTATANYLSRTDATLTAGFPGKVGSADADFSVGGWIKPTTTPATDGDVLGKENAFVLTANGAGIRFVVIDDAFGGHTANAASGLVAGTWVHVVCTWVQSTGAIVLYLNGVSAATATSATLRQQSTAFQIGWGNPAHGVFNGAVAEAFVFAGTALSATQAAAIYNNSLTGNLYTAYYATKAADPVQVLEDSTRLTVAASKTTMEIGSFWWDSGNTRVYVRSLEDATPVGHVIEAGARTKCIDLSAGKTYITIDSLELRAATLYGLHVRAQSSNLTLTNSVIRWNYSHGVNVNETTLTLANILVQGNTFDHNGASGLEFVAYHQSGNRVLNNVATWNSLPALLTGDFQFTAGLQFFGNGNDTGGLIVSGNTSTDNGFAYVSGSYFMRGVGIWLDTITNATVTRNYTARNRGPGIEIEKNVNVTCAYNVSVNDDLHGIGYGSVSNGFAAIYVRVGELVNGSGVLIANNVVYNAGYAGIGVLNANADATTISGTIVRNNIVLNATFANLFVGPGGNNDGTHGSGNLYDHNGFGVASATLAYWTGTGAISTYAGLDTAYGSAMSNVQTDPLFVNAAGGDFRLQAGSPAINAGVNVGLTSDYLGVAVPQGAAPDLGAYEAIP